MALCFITGADAFIKLAEWHSWRELFQLCHFIIAARPGHALTISRDDLPRELKDECAGRWVSSAEGLKQISSGLIFIAPTTLLDISATNERARAAAGKSLRYLVPDAVEIILRPTTCIRENYDACQTGENYCGCA